jgi:hypothetical protein
VSIFAADLAAMLTDTATTVAVSFGLQQCRGVLRSDDAPETDNAGGFVLSSRISLTIRADALTGLDEDSTIAVDGVNYRVRQLRHTGPQGLLYEVILV